jgi:hypothetical protein
MAKNNAFLLVGPAIPGVEELHQSLLDRADQLGEAGIGLPPKVSQADMFRAGVEILRTHKDQGLRRRDVEGSWARVCRKAFKVRGDVVIAQDALVDATAEQLALALDSLSGHRVQVVLTPAYADEGLADIWRPLVKKGRVHVIAGSDVDQLVRDLAALSLRERAERLEKRMRKLRKKQKRVAEALESVDAA